jgi:hypothetical protein
MFVGQAARLAQVLLIRNIGASIECKLKVDTFFDSSKLVTSPVKVLWQ